MTSCAARAAVGVLLVLAVAGCGGTSDAGVRPRATAVTSPHDAVSAGRIVYRRFLDDAETQGALYTSDADGTDEKQLTHPEAGVVDDEPNWSPDGSRLVFSLNGRHSRELTPAPSVPEDLRTGRSPT